MPEGTQRYSRTKMVLPLRVWLDDRAGETLPTQWAHTIDTSHIGCRLGKDWKGQALRSGCSTGTRGSNEDARSAPQGAPVRNTHKTPLL
jgi:hypothetical protein